MTSILAIAIGLFTPASFGPSPSPFPTPPIRIDSETYSRHLPKIKATYTPERVRATVDYDLLQRTLRQFTRRDYSGAAESYNQFSGYRDGNEPFETEFEEYAFRHEWRSALSSLYQTKFCPGHGTGLGFNPTTVDGGVLPIFADALDDAANGRDHSALLGLEKALHVDAHFSLALTVRALIAAEHEDRHEEYAILLAAAKNPDYALNDAIGIYQRVSVELLLHDKL